MTELLAEPPSPIQVSVSVAGSFRVTDWLPLSDLLPDQAPDAVQLVASVELQLNVVEPPRLIREALALRLTVGGLTTGG